MTQESKNTPPLFTQVEVSPTSNGYNASSPDTSVLLQQTKLMKQLLEAVDRQNELLEEMVEQNQAAQKQKVTELQLWKKANPVLSNNCRKASETLSQVQANFLEALTEEIIENGDILTEGDFMMTEFVDRFGPRLAHLNGILQILSQLGSNSQTD